jgi:hypothetical protein
MWLQFIEEILQRIFYFVLSLFHGSETKFISSFRKWHRMASFLLSADSILAYHIHVLLGSSISLPLDKRKWIRVVLQWINHAGM